jgi:hypothetical protein
MVFVAAPHWRGTGAPSEVALRVELTRCQPVGGRPLFAHLRLLSDVSNRPIADIPDRCRERPRTIRRANARDRPAKPEPCAATPRRPALEGRSGPEGYDSEGRRRASSPASSAWRRVFVLANTAFNWVRAVSRLTPTAAAAESIPTPEASLVASLASAAVRPKAAHKFFELGRSGDLRSVRRRIRRPNGTNRCRTP